MNVYETADSIYGFSSVFAWSDDKPSPDVRLFTGGERALSLRCLLCIGDRTSGWEHIPAPEGWMDVYDADRRLLEEDGYDLRNLPAVYLLDADKKVLLKNATLQ